MKRSKKSGTRVIGKRKRDTPRVPVAQQIEVGSATIHRVVRGRYDRHDAWLRPGEEGRTGRAEQQGATAARAAAAVDESDDGG